MDKKLFRSLLALITYTILLALLLVRFDDVHSWVGVVFTTLKPLVFGFGLAFVLHRPCKFFHRVALKLPLGKYQQRLAFPLAVATSYVMLFAIVYGLVSFVLPQFVDSMVLFASNINTYAAQLQVLLTALFEFLDFSILDSLDFTSVGKIIQDVFTNAVSIMTSFVPSIFQLTSSVLSFVIMLLLSLIFSVYMLSSGDVLCRQVSHLVSAYLPKQAPLIFDVTEITANTFTRFISGQLLEACILGGLCFVGMAILQLDYAPLIGVIIGVCALVPIVGAYVGATVSALLLVMVEPRQAIVFLVFLVLLQQFEGNVIYPRVVGSSIGLPGIWVLAAVTVGGGLFGFAGMLLGVPVTSVLYVLLRRDVRKRLNS